MSLKVLGIDDEQEHLEYMAKFAKNAKFEFEGARSLDEAMHRIQDSGRRSEQFDVILLDLYLDGVASVREIPRLSLLSGGASIIAVSGHPELLHDAVEIGVTEAIQKPFDMEMLHGLVLRRIELKREESRIQAKLMERANPENRLVFAPNGILARRIMPNIRRAVRFPKLHVLLEGPTGTGKDHIAQAIFRMLHSDYRPLIVNCAAIPKDQFEQEFFGVEPDIFTHGPRGKAKRGLYELANGRTLILQEFGALPDELQLKLNTALQERQIRRVGGERDIPVEVRVICTTHEDVEQLVAAGRMQRSLFHRISGGIRIQIPPLSEHPEDIPLLTRHFLDCFIAHSGFNVALDLQPSAKEFIASLPWPGNTRQLKQAVEAAASKALDSGLSAISPFHFPPSLRRDQDLDPPDAPQDAYLGRPDAAEIGPQQLTTPVALVQSLSEALCLAPFGQLPERQRFIDTVHETFYHWAMEVCPEAGKRAQMMGDSRQTDYRLRKTIAPALLTTELRTSDSGTPVVVGDIGPVLDATVTEDMLEVPPPHAFGLGLGEFVAAHERPPLQLQDSVVLAGRTFIGRTASTQLDGYRTPYHVGFTGGFCKVHHFHQTEGCGGTHRLEDLLRTIALHGSQTGAPLKGFAGILEARREDLEAVLTKQAPIRKNSIPGKQIIDPGIADRFFERADFAGLLGARQVLTVLVSGCVAGQEFADTEQGRRLFYRSTVTGTASAFPSHVHALVTSSSVLSGVGFASLHSALAGSKADNTNGALSRLFDAALQGDEGGCVVHLHGDSAFTRGFLGVLSSTLPA